MVYGVFAGRTEAGAGTTRSSGTGRVPAAEPGAAVPAAGSEDGLAVAAVPAPAATASSREHRRLRRIRRRPTASPIVKRIRQVNSSGTFVKRIPQADQAFILRT